MKQPMKDMMQKERFDNLHTPEEAIWPLIDHIPHSPLFKRVWECTDFGDSQITKTFRNEGFEVVGTDIVNGMNFLTCQPPPFDWIVTNPPYSLKDQFLERCYQLNKPFALLLPLTALEGIKRGSLFQHYGIDLIVLNRRIDFTGKKANWFNVSWFCWNVFNNTRMNEIIFEEV